MIFTFIRRTLFAIAISLGLALLFASGAAEQKLTVGGMDVFYGVMPAEIAKMRTDKHDSEMHSGQRQGKNLRHLVIALFDTQTGQRISDATIDATVTPLGLTPDRKRLDPMLIAQTITYGNFFEFQRDSGPFRITLKINRPNHPAQTAEFEYRQ